MDRVATALYERVRLEQDRAANAAFRRAIKDLGAGSLIRYPFVVYQPQFFSIGRNFEAHAGLRLEAWDRYGQDVFTPRITIGDDVIFNFDVHIGAISHLIIGSGVLVGSRVLITDHAHGRTSGDDLFVPPRLRRLASKGQTVIEDNVWIGEGACILDGVRIGKNSVIGANSVVTRDVPANTVAAGSPARPIHRSKMGAHDQPSRI